jgi:hypothetical protein
MSLVWQVRLAEQAEEDLLDIVATRPEPMSELPRTLPRALPTAREYALSHA